MRLTGEPLCLPVRIIAKVRNKNQYSLMSRNGPIKGFFSGSDLNIVDPIHISTFGKDISTKYLEKGNSSVLITLSKAIQLENSCRTVANAQRQGRKQPNPSVEAAVEVAPRQAVSKGRKRKGNALEDLHSEVESSNIVSGKRQRKQ